MFEALMPDIVVPETSWGISSFGLADQRTAQVQIKYATQQLHDPVWGMSPSSTPDDSGDYAGYGVEGLEFPYYGTGATAAHPNEQLAQCNTCATENAVTLYESFIALDVAPQQSYANIEALRTLYPGVYGTDGYFDADRRLLRRGRPRDRRRRTPVPGARPVDDHGSAGQRAEQPGHPAGLRQQFRGLGGPHLPVTRYVLPRRVSRETRQQPSPGQLGDVCCRRLVTKEEPEPPTPLRTPSGAGVRAVYKDGRAVRGRLA
jgi:hypothetical protein